MKAGILYALALVVLINGEYQGGRELRNADRYGHLLRIVRTADSDLRICEPGSTKKEDCNNCFCNAIGSGWACTRKGCNAPVFVNSDDTSAQPDKANLSQHAKQVDTPFTCTPNETFAMDCNTCWCSSDGRSAACTLKGCFSYNNIFLKPTEITNPVT